MKEKTKRVTIEVPLSLLKKIEGQAKASERDVSKQIRYILNSYYLTKKEER